MSAAKRSATRRRTAYAATTLVLATGGPTMLGFVSAVGPFWALLLLPGIAAILAAAIMQIVQLHRDNKRLSSEEEQRTDARQRFRDAFKPLAEYTAKLPSHTYAERSLLLQNVAQAATISLYMLISPHIKDVRANVFVLDDNPDRMTWLSHTGRGTTPRAFESGTARGDAALAFVERHEPAFYPDLTTHRPDGYEGSMADYETFISVPIWAEGSVYGMVSVDAPLKNTLSIGDQYLVELVADHLATAFAVANMEPPPPSPTSEASA
ncbi:GAF domain-containing protein [Microbacterium sp. Leaf159]|uniref:GAF domain-containing protein n=1 Tax=Microbacterium sp. Leaf159 TaxID=1736279 RepID=UPI0009EB9A08|nr:GAF domain-containing protein [Microbacterium sp. Leaf159]